MGDYIYKNDAYNTTTDIRCARLRMDFHGANRLAVVVVVALTPNVLQTKTSEQLCVGQKPGASEGVMMMLCCTLGVQNDDMVCVCV